MNHIEEKELIRKAKNGDQNAFTSLIRANKLLVKQISRKFFLVGFEDDDLLQEGMIGLTSAISSFDESREASFSTYAKLCVKRSILSLIKKSNSKKNKILNESAPLDNQGGLVIETNSDDEDDFSFIIPASNSLPDDKLIWKERLDEIRLFVLNTLSVYEKLVLSEYLKGKSYHDISVAVAKPESSVENALSRIRIKLSPLKKPL